MPLTRTKQPAKAFASSYPWALGALFVLIAATAFALIYVKHLERHHYHQLQLAQKRAHFLHVEWNQLLLEQSTWAAPARLQSMASLHFGLKMPEARDLVMVDLV